MVLILTWYDVRMRNPLLYLMLGYPGAGKTSTAKIIHELTGAEHLWADLVRRDMFGRPKYSHTENIQLYEHMNNLAEKLLNEGIDVIFDTNFNFYKDRLRLRQIAEKSGAKTIVIWVTTPKDTARRRATDGGGHHTRVLGDMPVEEFERMSGHLEPPRSNETVIKIDGTKISADTVRKLLLSHGTNLF